MNCVDKKTKYHIEVAQFPIILKDLLKKSPEQLITHPKKKPPTVNKKARNLKKVETTGVSQKSKNNQEKKTPEKTEKLKRKNIALDKFPTSSLTE